MTPGNGYCFRYGQLLGVVCRDDPRCEEVVAESACDPTQPSDCLAAMLLWGGMYVMGFFLLLVGSAMVVITSSVKSAKHITGQASGSFKSPLVRIFMLSFLVLMGKSWPEFTLGCVRIPPVVPCFAACLCLLSFGCLGRVQHPWRFHPSRTSIISLCGSQCPCLTRVSVRLHLCGGILHGLVD